MLCFFFIEVVGRTPTPYTLTCNDGESHGAKLGVFGSLTTTRGRYRSSFASFYGAITPAIHGYAFAPLKRSTRRLNAWFAPWRVTHTQWFIRSKPKYPQFLPHHAQSNIIATQQCNIAISQHLVLMNILYSSSRMLLAILYAVSRWYNILYAVGRL